MMRKTGLRRIVTPGAGLGGKLAVFEISEVACGKADLSDISDSDQFLFLPFNTWGAAGGRKANGCISARSRLTHTSFGKSAKAKMGHFMRAWRLS